MRLSSPLRPLDIRLGLELRSTLLFVCCKNDFPADLSEDLDKTLFPLNPKLTFDCLDGEAKFLERFDSNKLCSPYRDKSRTECELRCELQ